jgi:hypothetical protein
MNTFDKAPLADNPMGWLTGQSHGAMFEAPNMLADAIIDYLSES